MTPMGDLCQVSLSTSPSYAISTRSLQQPPRDFQRAAVTPAGRTPEVQVAEVEAWLNGANV